MTGNWPFKDPDEILDYEIDWSTRVVNGDTIGLSFWDAQPGGLTMLSDSVAGLSTIIWLQAGIEGTTYSLTNHIYTTGGRQMDQTVRLRIKSK